MSSSFPPDPTEAPPGDPGGEAPGIPDPPAVARDIFGDRLPIALRYADLLADTGVSHGLIGPREVPRLWSRHLLNCAVVGEAMPVSGALVVDVGSGAGLPGIPLAIARPDLQIHLVEPMLRRTEWLSAVVAELGLDTVTVHRGRAQEYAARLPSRYVTSRAVARLPKLLGWCAPLLAPGGEIVAMKGSSAAEELAEAGPLLRRLRLGSGSVVAVGRTLAEPTTLVVVPRRS